MAGIRDPEIETLVDRLIEKAGTEDEAIRLIKARKTKRKRGRPDYEALDYGLIVLAGVLLDEWRIRLRSSPRGRGLPTRHALATKIVDMLWDDHDVVKRFNFVRRGLKHFGASSKETVVKRLLGRSVDYWNAALKGEDEFLEELKLDYPELYVQHIQHCPRRSRGSGGLVELFEAVHRRRPDLHLLPGRSFR
jgi:hypothetical protein